MDGCRRLLAILLVCATASGCQSWLKRGTWNAPVLALPQVFKADDASLRALWESYYAQGIQSEARGDAACVDYYFQAATLAWQEMAPGYSLGADASSAEQTRAAEVYRSSLVQLIHAGQQFGRLDPKQGLVVHTTAGRMLIPARFYGFPWNGDQFDRLIPVGNYASRDINTSYRSPGVGLAAIALRYRRSREPFRPERQAVAVTLVLRPVDGASPHDSGQYALEYYDPLRVAVVQTARPLPLKRDITAPLAYLLSQSDQTYLRRFFQPGATAGDGGLQMLEPYQPGKIPVVFVHGLLADPSTWATLANELRARPDLLDRYQIWFFEYDTGAPFLQSASTLRRQLRELYARLDPLARDRALARMFLIGHSMGGLISKLQATYSGTQLWNAVSRQPLQQIVTTAETRKRLTNSFFFEPSPLVSRVVFVGTPHVGSPWAERPIGRLGSALIRETPQMEEDHQQLLQDNPGVFSDEFAAGIPTSVDLLEPESKLLHAIDSLPFACHVQLHSIVGSGYHMIGVGDSDNVVPFVSASKQGVLSEKTVFAKHAELNKHPDSVQELMRLLRFHVQDFQSERFH